MISLLDIDRNDSETALAFLAEQEWSVSPLVWTMLLRLHDDDKRDAFVDEAERRGPVEVG